MEKPNFEIMDPNFELSVGQIVYYVDENGHDIWKAKVLRILQKGIEFLLLKTGEKKRYKGKRRILLCTDRNNQIFEEQEKEREKPDPIIISESTNEEIKENDNGDDAKKENIDEEKEIEEVKDEKKDDDNKEENKKVLVRKEIPDDNEETQTKSVDEEKAKTDKSDQSASSFQDKQKKKKKVKRPIIDNHTIAQKAWDNGIHEIEGFRNFMTENINAAVREFEKIYKMNNVEKHPPFALGGKLEEEKIPKFWVEAHLLWKSLFYDQEEVSNHEFLRIATPYFKLPYQTESNAREALKFIFDPQSNPSIDFIQFCSFLAMFGPPRTAIRKIGHWLKCPPELRDELLFPDIPDDDDLSEDAEMNCFTLKSKNSDNEKTVYNIPYADTDDFYLIDMDDHLYKDWPEYFEKNLPEMDNKEKDE